jgi:integrase
MSGEIGLWQHPDSGRWYVTWTVGTRSNRVSTRTRDRGEAEKFRAAFVLERDRRPEAKPDEIALEAILDDYWEGHAKNLPSAERADIAIKHLKAFYGSGTVSLVNARSHDRYIALCKSEGKSPGTINQHLTRLRAALKRAVQNGELAAAPFVPSLEEPEPRPHALTRPQIAAMLWAARSLGYDHIALFIRIAVYTGARRGAILDLTWDRVDLRAGTVDFRLPGVNHSRKRRAATGIPTRLVASLRRLRKRQTGDHVIQYHNARNSDGERRTTRSVKGVRRAFRNTVDRANEILKKAGEKKLPHVTPHVLKHTAASLALPLVSAWIVSGMMATSMRTLQKVYGKHMMSDLKAGAEMLAQGRVRANHAQKPPTKKAVRKSAKKRKMLPRKG